ncbi:MAG: CocE/NonD family hydrolase [Oscillibacter sp.]|nr:CocE/NonD family hydrolase [Oscillibacter sp.]
MKRMWSLLLCALLVLSLTACGQAPVQEPDTSGEPVESAAPEKEFVECSGGYASAEFVTMEDGTEICCLVVRPEKEGQFPTVVTQTCYQQPTEEFSAEYIDGCVGTSAEFVEAGYTFVNIQTRGTGNSPFESYLAYIHDTDDELQVFDWIRQQDFYNGEIFCNGMSYMGFMSMSHLTAPHDDIKAVSLQCPVNARYDAWYQNGFLKIGLMGYWQSWMHRPAGHTSTALGNTMDMSLFNTFPYANWPQVMYGQEDDYWNGIITHPKDDDWWRKESAGAYIYDAVAAIDIPVLLYENFYDIFFEDNCAMWNAFSPGQKAQSAFLIDQFGHTTPHTYKEDGAPFFDKATLLTDFNIQYVVDFFESVRNGAEPANVELGAVTYHPIDGTAWYTEEGNFTAGSEEQVLYLNDGTLDAAAGTERAITYTYDPSDPAVFAASDENGGNGTNGYAGLNTEPEPGARQDVITFLGAPVESETFIKGVLTADLTVSSDCPDTCFFVRMDVVKDGVAYNLREDITSLSHQLGAYTPGDKVTLHFETSPVACQLNPGDFIRVDVTSSAAGMYALHTNQAGNQWEIAEPAVAQNTIYTGSSSIRYFTENLNA